MGLLSLNTENRCGVRLSIPVSLPDVLAFSEKVFEWRGSAY